MFTPSILLLLASAGIMEARSVHEARHLHALVHQRAANGDASATTLSPNAIQSGSFNNGQLETGSDPGQAASLTSTNNFINNCAGKTLTNGLQITTGSCNGIPMGDIPAKTSMVSSIITFPLSGSASKLQSDTSFNITVQTQNLVAGSFTNADATYYAAPQALSGGKVVGHTHVTVQDLGSSLNPTKALDATQFAFFKGINDAGNGQGLLTAVVTGGLPAGNYRVCTMASSSNHQPVLMPVAQRGTPDDCTKFTVGGTGTTINVAANNGAKGIAAAAAAAAAVSLGPDVNVSQTAAAVANSTSVAASNTAKGGKGGKGNTDKTSTSVAASITANRGNGKANATSTAEAASISSKAGGGRGKAGNAAATGTGTAATATSQAANAATGTSTAGAATGTGAGAGKGGKGGKAGTTTLSSNGTTTVSSTATTTTAKNGGGGKIIKGGSGNGGKGSGTTSAVAVISTSVVQKVTVIETFFEFAFGLGGLPPSVSKNGNQFLVLEKIFEDITLACGAACEEQFTTCTALEGPGFSFEECSTQKESCGSAASSQSSQAAPTKVTATVTVLPTATVTGSILSETTISTTFTSTSTGAGAAVTNAPPVVTGSNAGPTNGPPAVATPDVANNVQASSVCTLTTSTIFVDAPAQTDAPSSPPAVAQAASSNTSCSTGATGTGSAAIPVNTATLVADSSALGGIAAPPVTNSGDSTRPFEVNGNTFVNKSAAVQRSCDIQFNACANAVNSGSATGFNISDCQTQEDNCITTGSA